MFSHDIFRNLRVRALIVHEGKLLILPRPDHVGGDPPQPGAVPGGGLLPDESLYDAAAREVLEETGLRVRATSVAFLREWVVPKHFALDEARAMVEAHLAARGEPTHSADYAYGLEVFVWAELIPGEGVDATTYDEIEGPVRWVPFADVEHQPVFPPELRALARRLAAGHPPVGVPSFLAHVSTPWDEPDPEAFAS